ncbi:MAG TPA: hypothetical protein VMS22_18980 [Candidatus Eisenbacteria bacterium]|nr:hypothetical protein [Candidatus Eisenbacteria bacterium]
MVPTGPLLARDFASTILDIVPDTPCYDDSVACALRSLVDYLLPLSLVFVGGVAIGLLLAVSVSVLSARFERRRGPITPRRRRLVSGPIHTDGTWVRLVEDERGRRTVEVLEGANWRPSTRDLTHLLLDVPVTRTR